MASSDSDENLQLHLGRMEERFRSQTREHNSLILNQLADLNARLTPQRLETPAPPPVATPPPVARSHWLSRFISLVVFMVDRQPTAVMFFFNVLLSLFTLNGSTVCLPHPSGSKSKWKWDWAMFFVLIGIATFSYLTYFLRGFRGADGRRHYALMGPKGPMLLSFWVEADERIVDPSLYLRPLSRMDTIGAILKSLVFLSSALANKHVQECFISEQQTTFQKYFFGSAPVVFVVIYSFFVVFVVKRDHEH